MSAYFFYFFQLLNISCFSFLKQTYKKKIEKKIKFNINHIDKSKFLIIYFSVYITALSEKNIQNNFRITELILYNLKQVFIYLNI